MLQMTYEKEMVMVLAQTKLMTNKQAYRQHLTNYFVSIAIHVFKDSFCR